MGTNYYLQRDACPHCGHAPESLHIGKSSGGWCFSLHVYPEDGINDLDDWMPLFESTPIKNEYGDDVSCSDMLAIIRDRTWRARDLSKPPVFYDSWDHFFRSNHAIPGPANLARRVIDGSHCVGHGDGTWDLIVGEFS